MREPARQRSDRRRLRPITLEAARSTGSTTGTRRAAGTRYRSEAQAHRLRASPAAAIRGRAAIRGGPMRGTSAAAIRPAHRDGPSRWKPAGFACGTAHTLRAVPDQQQGPGAACPLRTPETHDTPDTQEDKKALAIYLPRVYYGKLKRKEKDKGGRHGHRRARSDRRGLRPITLEDVTPHSLRRSGPQLRQPDRKRGV